MDPFETLLDIEQNCKTHALSIPRQIVAERDWFGVGFRSSNIHFVCPIDEVVEVLTWPSLTLVPGAYPWFKGIINLRGRILPVTDLQGFVTGVPHPEKLLSRVLVVSYKKHLYGFSVEQALAIERFFKEEIKSVESSPDTEKYLPYVKGTFEKEHQRWVVLSFYSIIESLEFYHLISANLETA